LSLWARDGRYGGTGVAGIEVRLARAETQWPKFSVGTTFKLDGLPGDP
jgi:hypothetical protein